MKNEKIKRNIAGLLALVQLGLVAGCSSKKPQEDKSETLAAIEEMQDAKSGDEENLTDAGVVEFNEELLKELGIDFNISNDETIQLNISTLNSFLSQYQNVSYSAENDPNVDDEHIGSIITFKSLDDTIATVNITKNIRYPKLEIEVIQIELTPLCNTISGTDFSLTPNRIKVILIAGIRKGSTNMARVSHKWWLGNTSYSLSDTQAYHSVNGIEQMQKIVAFNTNNYDTESGRSLASGQSLLLSLNGDINKHKPIGEEVNVVNGAYTLKLSAVNDEYGVQSITVDINQEDYNALYNIVQSKKFCDINLAIKDALIETIQTYASEEQSKPLIDMLNSTYNRQR